MNLKGLPEDVATLLRVWVDDYVISDLERGLLECSVGRVTANAIRRQLATTGEAEGALVPAMNFAPHVIDWLRSSVLEDAPWLHNVDELGRPKKLMKFGTLDDILREVDKAMARRNAQQAKALSVADERHIADLADGYKVVRLMTPAALDLESRRMHHCVGHGSYDRGVLDGSTEIYSLRKPNGMPVVTIEIALDRDDDDAIIEQVEGAHNSGLDPEHIAILKPFVVARKWVGYDTVYSYWPRALDVYGTIHDLFDLPAGVEFENLSVAGAEQRCLLPNDMTVRVDLTVGSYRDQAMNFVFGERINVGETLRISVPKGITAVLPECLQVGGSIIHGGDGTLQVPEHLRDKVVRQKPIRPEMIDRWFTWAEMLETPVVYHDIDFLNGSRAVAAGADVQAQPAVSFTEFRDRALRDMYAGLTTRTLEIEAPREAETRTRPLTIDELRMRNRPRVTPPYEALRDRRGGRGRRRAA